MAGENYGIPGVCFDINGDRWHALGECPNCWPAQGESDEQNDREETQGAGAESSHQPGANRGVTSCDRGRADLEGVGRREVIAALAMDQAAELLGRRLKK